MGHRRIHNLDWVYIVSSIPVLMFYAAGLSGWFFDYPLVLFFSIFILFAMPLVLILLRSSNAIAWNITMLWVSSTLMILRILYGIVFEGLLEGFAPLRVERLAQSAPMLLGIIVFSLGWAVVWTKYFRRLTISV